MQKQMYQFIILLCVLFALVSCSTPSPLSQENKTPTNVSSSLPSVAPSIAPSITPTASHVVPFYTPSLSLASPGYSSGTGPTLAPPGYSYAGPTAVPTPAVTSIPTPGFSAIPSAVQQVGNTSVRIYVADDKGNFLDGATVTAEILVTGAGTFPNGQTTMTVTASNGNAIFNGVPQGVQVKYTLSKPGYTTRSLTYSAVTGGSGTSILNDIAFGNPGASAIQTSAPVYPVPSSMPTSVLINPVPTVIPSVPTPIDSTNTPPPTQNAKYFYFSYDDSASTVGLELTKNALNNNSLPNPSYARVYEFLNGENFEHTDLESTGLFGVSMGLWEHQNIKNTNNKIYELGTHITAPYISRETRKNIVLTLIIDVSGSMGDYSAPNNFEISRIYKLELVKYALKLLVNNLKTGDIINVVTFSTYASTKLENYAFNPVNFNPDTDLYIQTINNLFNTGSTNLNEGIDLGYSLASKYYDSQKSNRVLMLTDAYANTGEIDSTKISNRTRVNNTEGIYFSGIGVGQDFNEAFLDKLTEEGKGVYASLVSPTDATRIALERFIPLVNVAARDVQFRIDYPVALDHIQSAAEQVSQVQSQVLPTNFSYNTSQFFLEKFDKIQEADLNNQTFKITISYKNMETGQQVTEIYEKKCSEIFNKQLSNIKDAHTIELLAKLIKGEITAEQSQQDISTNLAGHQSRLFTEYSTFINRWISLKK